MIVFDFFLNYHFLLAKYTDSSTFYGNRDTTNCKDKYITKLLKVIYGKTLYYRQFRDMRSKCYFTQIYVIKTSTFQMRCI